MKRIGVVISCLVFCASAAGFASEAKATAAVKIAYVDLKRALNEVEEGKKAKANLEAQGKELQKKLEIREKELQGMKANLDKQRPILSGDALREKETDFQRNVMELQRMGLESERTFAEKETELIKPIGDKLKKVIAQIGEEGSYTVILPKEAVLYTPGGTDITDQVIKKYNQAK